MPTLLITGGSGFFAWNAWREFAECGYKVVLTSRMPAKVASIQGAPQTVGMEIVDQAEVAAVLSSVRPDVVVHAGALAQPSECESNHLRTREVNVVGSSNVFSVCTALGVPFIFMSTDLVYDGGKGNYSEDDDAHPSLEYGRSKRELEVALSKQQLFPLWSIVRSSLMFDNPTPWSEGYPGFATEALLRGEETTLFTDQYRTPVYVKDVARGIDSIVKGKLFGQVFNIGGPERVNRVDFVRRYCRVAGIDDSKIREVSQQDMPDYITKVADVSLNSRRLMQQSDWRPTPLVAAFESMLQDYA